MLAFLLGQLAIFSELGREVGVGFLLVGISSSVRSTGVARVVFIVAVVAFIFVRVRSGGVAGVGTLTLVIGVFGLWSGQSFPGHFRAVFPIARIDRLGKGAEFGEGVRFTDVGDFVLDLGWEPMVQLLA